MRDTPTMIELAEGGTTRVALPVQADGVGDHTINVTLTTPDGSVLNRVLTLGMRANDPVISATRRFSLGVGEVFTFDDNIVANLRPDTARATLAAGPLARFDMPGLLRLLDRYPYGSTEHVTSAALPLLYMPQVAGAAGIDGIRDRIDDAITRVLTRQAGNGAFGLWQAGSGEFWLDAYVTDFLTRAQVVTLITHGVPVTPVEQGGYGYSITRTAYDLDGAPMSGSWRVGERRVIVLRAVPFEEVGARLMIDDPLPAGIEIDNPDLLQSGGVRGLDWLTLVDTEYAEFRSDRFLAALDHRGDAFDLADIARAVSPGEFHRPAALVEDMYRSEYRAVSETGRTVVTG